MGDREARPPRPWLIACDESGIDGQSHYGFGTLWMPWDRRGTFSETWSRRRRQTGYEFECKWQKVNRGSIEFCSRTVDSFFETPWLLFHALIVEKSRVDRRRNQNDWDLTRRKHFTMLLANKIKRSVTSRGNDQTFNVWVDPIASRYKKADEAVEVIARNVVGALSGRRPDVKVRTHDSKETPAIQMCDLLLGAIMEAWNRKATRPEKAALAERIAKHLGWSDLAADTKPNAIKFNVWHFYDPTCERPRAAATRAVKIS